MHACEQPHPAGLASMWLHQALPGFHCLASTMRHDDEGRSEAPHRAGLPLPPPPPFIVFFVWANMPSCVRASLIPLIPLARLSSRVDDNFLFILLLLLTRAGGVVTRLSLKLWAVMCVR